MMRCRSRTVRAVLALAFAIASAPQVALAHAALLHSSPRNGSVAEPGISAIRLVFSEEMVPDLCHVGLTTPQGAHVNLAVSSDPHDVHAIIASVSRLAPGAYHVMWHAVSADGHPVSGEFGFTVAGTAAAPASNTAPIVPQSDSAELHGEQNPFPFAAAIARGVGVTALLSLAGLLVFAGGHSGSRVEEYRALEKILSAVSFAALLAHLVLWDRYVLPGGMFASASWQAMLASPPGRLELLRLIAVFVCALLVFAGLRPQLPAVVAAVAVVFTGTIGHPSSTVPLLSIPVTVIHVTAVALWVGGVLSLIVVRRAEPVSFRAHALLVSRVAFAAFFVTAITGAAQSALLLTAVSDFFTTPYGRLLLAKIAGLLLLGGFGAYHRLRVMPRLPGGGQKEMIISLRYEATVMCVVIVVAAFLSYTPLPR